MHKSPWLPLLLGVVLAFSACESTRKTTTSAPGQPAKPSAKRFELLDGDRVVFLGDTLMEREQYYGWIELMLTTRFPDRNVTFRNLGWSADTPDGISRTGLSLLQAGLEPPDEGWKMLQKQIEDVKPTVVFLGYGMASSFDGEKGLPKFTADMNRLMDTIQKIAGESKVHFVLLSPIKHEDCGSPLPDPAKHNEQLALYTKAIKEIAKQRGAPFVSLFDSMAIETRAKTKKPLTDQGIHLNSEGYRLAAQKIEVALGWSRGKWATSASTEPLRQVILKKNSFFFDRSRPQNMAYIFGFRKREQGQNAVEIPQFDPLIEAEEKKIAALRSLKPGRPGSTPAQSIRDGGARVEPRPPTSRPSPRPLTPQPKPDFTLADGFEITLWAEDPQLAKPIQMNFDPQGRLWVVSSEVYPQIEPGQTANDKVLILEDTNGGGRANKSTVFVDGLMVPTGVLPGDGGVYVANSTELLHFKDTDGDGRADTRRVVLSGFGTEDTHHILHTLRWGPDGALYMNQSIYIRTHTETPHGVRRLLSGGIWRFRPDTMQLDVLFKGWINAWGHAFDEFGQSFISDGAGFHGISWGMPGAMYETYAKARRILDTISPGNYPKFAGLEIIYSRHFPDDWHGDLVTCDFRAHRVVRFKVSEQGAGYVTREMPDLVRTSEATFRPIDVKLGLDGALYIADWSNPIIQHGEVDFRDSRRDHEHGRIWRVAAKSRPLNKKPELVKASIEELLKQIHSQDGFNRERAQRVLAEQPSKVLDYIRRNTKFLMPALRDAFDQFPDLERQASEVHRRLFGLNAPDQPHAHEGAGAFESPSEKDLLQSLWLRQAVGVIDTAYLARLLHSKDGHTRAAAVRALGACGGLADGPEGSIPILHTRVINNTPTLTVDDLRLPPFVIRMLDKLVVDDHPRVRVEAMRALAKIPSARSAELVLTVADSIKLNAEGKPEDPFLDYACWLSINDLAEPWLAALKSGAWKPEGREKQLEFGLKAIEPRLASEVLAQLLGDQPLPQNGSGPWIELIGAAGSPKELRRLFDQLLKGEFVEPAAIRAFTALADASRLRNVKPDGELASFGPMLRSNGEKVRLAALQLAGTWKLAKFIPQISQSAGDINASAVVRSAAFTALRDISGSGAADALAPLCAKDRPLEIRRAAIVALAGVNLNRAAPLAAEVLAATEEEDKALELWRDLLKVKGAGKAIGAKVGQASRLPSGEPPSTPAAENGRDARPTLSASVARAGTLAAQEGGRTEPELLAALAVSSTPDTSLINITPELIQELAQRAVKEGDPARGELIYRRASLACTSCHAIGGAGGKVGPDMTSIGGSAPVDYLVESLLLPNAKIKEGYHSVLVETKDEQEFSGILVRESEQEVVIRNAANVEISVAKNKIARRSTGLSLMPSGLMESLPMNERLDLFRFLSELGKPGPYDAAKSGVARSWKILGGTHRVEQFGIEKLVSGDLTDADWKPVASLVDGRLLREEIKEQTKLGINLGLVGVYAGTQFNVATAGAVGFQLDGAPQVQAWIDGKSVSAKGAIKADLSAGKHTIILRFDPKDLPEQVRLKSGDVTFVGN